MRSFNKTILLITISVVLTGCNSSEENLGDVIDDAPIISEESDFYYGADISYVNEMEDCGAIYKDRNGTENDAYQIFKEEGANLARLRLWHNPIWTDYSNLEDVKTSIQRAKALDMDVLLNFHYSDIWADPSSQQIPAAWMSEIDNIENLGNLLYDYTYQTLNELSSLNLMPEIVQIGNEINGMILQDGELEWPIDWERNSFLLNKGIEAVRDVSEATNKEIEIMLHIAQPENGLWWFEQATQVGVIDFDWIGLSYYPQWSEFNLADVDVPLSTLMSTYNKKMMIVETAYPFTLDNVDSANNILGADALIDGYPATQEGQLNYLNQLKNIVENVGGQGVVYWEPAWVSTNCSTPWGQGSHWDNATLFDNEGQMTLGMQFFNSNLEE
ncbi:MAG: glycosyl hydrolase 53 family protein [Bacteroidota bacterium]